MSRHAFVQVDLGAIAHNVEVLRDLGGSARLCAVVKADGYGHGAVEIARTAVAHGASMLGVALVDEGVVLRDHGIDAPILVLSEPPEDALREAWDRRLTPTLYHEDTVALAAEMVPRGDHWGVQVKVDTGMHRVGIHPDRVVDLAAAVVASPVLRLDGVFTHLAVADEPDRPETAHQLERFEAVVADLRAKGIDPGTVHAANSAGLIAHPGARLDMIRAGISVYGLAPSPELEGMVDLRPAMSVVSEVSHLAVVPAGDGVSYGLRHRFENDTSVAVVPIGYADGISRRMWSTGGEVLIGGTRRPIRGVVTMDQIVVELGPPGGVRGDPPVARGDEVVLLGRQAGATRTEEITAGEWAEQLGTIAYEVVCGFGPRLPRRYVR